MGLPQSPVFSHWRNRVLVSGQKQWWDWSKLGWSRSLASQFWGSKRQREVSNLLGLTVVGVALAGVVRQLTGKTRLAVLWGCAELAFFAYQRWRYYVLNRVIEEVPDVSRVPEIKQRFLALKDVIDVTEFLSLWFHGAPYESIWRGNVEDFVAYGFYCQRFADLSPEVRQRTTEFVDQLEIQWGVTFPPGTNPDVQYMAHLWEPLRVFHKPLLLHLGAEVGGIAAAAVLRSWGAKKYVLNDMPYWLRLPQQAVPLGMGLDVTLRGDSATSLSASNNHRPSQRPIVFLHGVGFGMLPYMRFLKDIGAACPGHPIILVEFRHVSLGLSLEAVTVEEVTHGLARILQRHGYADACFLAHSYGTFCASRLVQLYPSMVASLMLVDPVCLMTCSPHLLRNFIYKLPALRHIASRHGAVDIARYFCARDLVISQAFCRRFHWHTLMLWPQDMPDSSVVVLSAHDDLVPLHLVQSQLHTAASPATVLVHPTAGHGGFLMDHGFQKRMITQLQRIAGAAPGSAGGGKAARS